MGLLRGLLAPGATHGRAALVGQPVLLGPLPAGVHTIVSVYRYRRGTPLVSEYVLSVSG